MCPHVRHQVAGPRERPAARLTDISLLSRMREHVPSQVAGIGERRAACLAVKAARRATTSHFHALVTCSLRRVRVNATSCIVHHATRAVRVCRVCHTRFRVTSCLGNRVIVTARALQLGRHLETLFDHIP